MNQHAVKANNKENCGGAHIQEQRTGILRALSVVDNR
jgi:hypothetical protein